MFRKVAAKLITTLLLSVASLLCTSSAYANNDAYLVFADSNKATENTLKTKLRKSDAVNSVISLINENFKLTQPIKVLFGAEDGPLFDPEINQIAIPYEFIKEIKARFRKDKYNESGVTIAQATDDVLMHTLFHEFAHALIYMYEIPVLGKEEDAADSLATILLIEYFEEGQEIALSAADMFDLESTDRNILEDEDFWDEHSLDSQRYFSTLCHIYGSDPDQFSSIIEDGFLSEERAELCIEEYQNVHQSWLKLLTPHFKNSKAH